MRLQPTKIRRGKRRRQGANPLVHKAAFETFEARILLSASSQWQDPVVGSVSLAGIAKNEVMLGSNGENGPQSGVTLLDHFIYPGEQFAAEWYIREELIDTNLNGEFDNEELARLQITIDALGIIDNHVSFTPIIGENAFVDLEGTLRGIVTMQARTSLPAGISVHLWMTLYLADEPASLVGPFIKDSSAIPMTGQGSTVHSSQSPAQGITNTLPSDKLSAFSDQFKGVINGQNAIAWLNDYVDTMHPGLADRPLARTLLLDRLALQAAANDEAAKYHTGNNPTQENLATELGSILERAYGASRVRLHSTWDASKPTIILVHGVANASSDVHVFSDFDATGRSLQMLTKSANVLTFNWGRTTWANGLRRQVLTLLEDLNTAPAGFDLGERLAVRLRQAEAQKNLFGAVDLHLLIKLLNRVYGTTARDNINIIAHSQGTVVTTAALMFGNNTDPDAPTGSSSVSDAPYYIHSVLFVGANLNRLATTPHVGEFNYVTPHLRNVTNLISQYDSTVTLFGTAIASNPGPLFPVA